MEKMKAPESF
jgi:mRNA deadenylase 3'-5' endonuclease subunit Ccr4